MKPATATISQSALRHNIELIKTFAPHQKLLAMIKANAYGQGLLPAAGALADLVDGFGVARLREALEIQETGYTGKFYW
ncbi:alanine racemase [Actinobacillus equuli]|nr:alanine racemase [Actinobacillus equuli]